MFIRCFIIKNNQSGNGMSNHTVGLTLPYAFSRGL